MSSADRMNGIVRSLLGKERWGRDAFQSKVALDKLLVKRYFALKCIPSITCVLLSLSPTVTSPSTTPSLPSDNTEGDLFSTLAYS